jgi:hypothetical protein
LQAALIASPGLWQHRVPVRATVSGPTIVHLGPHDADGPDLVVCRSQPTVGEHG